MADNSINSVNILARTGKSDSDSEVESFKIINKTKADRPRSYFLYCKGHGDDERSFEVEIKDPDRNFGFSQPLIRNQLNFLTTDLYIDRETQFQFQFSEENILLTTREMWELLDKGSIEKDGKTIDINVLEAYFSKLAFSQVGKGKKLRKRRQSRKNNKSSRKQRRSRKNNKSSRKVLKSRRRASRQKGGSGKEVTFVETTRGEVEAALKAGSVYFYGADIKLDGHIVIVSHPGSSEIKPGDYFFRKEPSNTNFTLTFFEAVVTDSELLKITIDEELYTREVHPDLYTKEKQDKRILKILQSEVTYDVANKSFSCKLIGEGEGKKSVILTEATLQGLSDAYARKSRGRNISSHIEQLIKQNRTTSLHRPKPFQNSTA